MPFYTARVIGKIDYGPNIVNGLRVGVFRVEGENEEPIGEYERNYSSLFRTFFPFCKGDQDYALYSREYTATRIMTLPACQDIGGEEPDSWGFCPVDFYVPSYIDRECVSWDDSIHRHRIHEPTPELQLAGTVKMYPLDPKTGQRVPVDKPTYPIGPLTYYPFGFVAGCIWGDDGSWKIQYLDLSEVDKGVLRRDARFGYLEMPKDMRLRQAIDMDHYHHDLTDEEDGITITVLRRFHLPSGKPVEEERRES